MEKNIHGFPLDDNDLDALMHARWEAADKIGAIKVQDIPMPWRHRFGTVVAIEYPPDRPRVVDLVFDDGLKTAETKDARYIEYRGIWTYPEE